MELRIDMKPQKPVLWRQQPFVTVKDGSRPFISVIKSAKCRALCSTYYQLSRISEDPVIVYLIIEKCPVSDARSCFCFS